MTLVQDAPTASTATGPTLGSTARSARGPLLVVAVLVLTGIVVGALSATAERARLDPESFGPSGSRAVAELLRGAGTEVVRVDTVEAALELDRAGDVLVIPEPQALAPAELEQLAEAELTPVVVGAEDEQLSALGIPAEVQGQADVEPRRPVCDLPAAQRAGDVDLGGLAYRATGGEAATGCYAVGGEATLLVVDGAVLLGEGALLTNDRLDERGNAALALGLLGLQTGGEQVSRVVWLVPRPGRALGDSGQPSLSELVADGVYAGAAQLLVVVAVLALWRARRLGRVVEEPLPVVVRASEAVEGRSRLYRAAGARGQAAESLRAATRDRLVRRLGAGTATGRPSLVSIVAERTGDDPATVDGLLYGAAPADDGALVRLSDDLRTLEKTLTRDANPSADQEVAGS